MKAKFLVAFVAALLLPLAGHAASGEDAGLIKAGKLPMPQKAAGSELLTPEDYIEYASINDVNIHELYFSTVLYEGTESCLMCHQDDAEAMLGMGHFKWQGKVANIEGLVGGDYGKNQLLNNFCVAVPSNEGRCTQCHTGYGYDHKSYNFNDPANIDCLVCHDQSGTYAKAPKTAGGPVDGIDLNVVARSIALSGTPSRTNCIKCHANAGGGDNVKHGDLAMNLKSTTREFDVHMGTDGGNLVCVDCHGANHEPDTGEYNHGVAGMALHSVHEGEMKQCTDCHGSVAAIHQDTGAADLLASGFHDRLACQVCHIPAIARHTATKTEWYWEDAGDANRVPQEIPGTGGMVDYNKMKGSFMWAKNVRPVLRWSNGMWERMVINVSDSYTSEPVQMAQPKGSYSDPDAMIYPFKKMIGNQPADANNNVILVPHLFGGKGGPNPYWAKYDWNLALQDGAAYTGQNYSGEYYFPMTEMLLTVNHEVAPKEMALGYGEAPDSCLDCHAGGGVDFTELGWTADPLSGGQRVEEGESVMLDRPAPLRLD